MFDEVNVAGPLKPGDYILTKVSDTGIGIPQDVIKRVFEPFFTTKKVGEGTGLGLSMIATFAKRSGGNVEITSRTGRGTSVLLYLPCIPAADGLQRSAQVQGEENTNQTVLLVDDNSGVRNVTERLLRQLGYEVMTADSGIAALSVLRHLKADVLLTDIVMPNMSGVELALAVSEKYPEMRIVHTSGFGSDGLLIGSRAHILPKPFTKIDLSLKLQEAFNSPDMLANERVA